MSHKFVWISPRVGSSRCLATLNLLLKIKRKTGTRAKERDRKKVNTHILWHKIKSVDVEVRFAYVTLNGHSHSTIDTQNKIEKRTKHSNFFFLNEWKCAQVDGHEKKNSGKQTFETLHDHEHQLLINSLLTDYCVWQQSAQ